MAVILSAQCTDERINQVTPALFDHFPTPSDLAKALPEEIALHIRSVTYFNSKARYLQKMAKKLLDRFNGKVPETIEELIQLPGVGRKTANVVISQAFGQPGISVDTHVKRVAYRLGFHKSNDPTKIEHILKKTWPQELWSHLSTLIILHGRTICQARKPKCEQCILEKLCPKNGV